jgi:DNA-binding CsgD family transcriptional regulator
MEIRTIFIWVCFVFCLGLTAGGILVLFRNKKYRKLPSARFLQYYLVLIYMFGFYSVWSSIFFQLIYGADTAFAGNNKIAGFLIILGIPFLLAGKVMLVWWSLNLLKKKPETLSLIAVFAVVFFPALMYTTYNREDILASIRQIYAVFVMTACCFISIILWFSTPDYLSKKQRLIFLLLVIFSGLIYIPLFIAALNQLVAELIFIFLFFLTNTSIAVYFIYSVRISSELTEVSIPVSFETFIAKYGITAREEEIIRLIYQGKTNKEIADTLFVTVQTIKDHTHRIYQKTDVRSRAQLTSLVRTFFTG